MAFRSLALAAALMATTALSAHAAVVGTQAFADIGAPTANTGDINTSTAFTLGDLVSTASQSGYFSGFPSQAFGSVSFDLTVPGSLVFGNSQFGTFTSTSFSPQVSSPGALAVYVLGSWAPGSFGGDTGGPYPSSFTIAFTQNPAHTGAISDSATFSVPPANAIPELSTWAMMGLGFAGLGFAGFRTRKRPPLAA